MCECEFRDRHWSNQWACIRSCDARRLHQRAWHTAKHRRALCSPEAAHINLRSSLHTRGEHCTYCEQLNRKWARYQHLFQAQCRLREKEGDIDMMTWAFESLASLTTITIANQHKDWDRNVRELLGDAWCERSDYGPVKDSGTHLMKVISKALAASSLKLHRFGQLSGYIESTSILRGEHTLDDIADLSQVLSRTVCQDVFPQLKVLHLESIYYSLDDIHQYRWWRERDENIFAQDFQRYTYCDKGNLSENRNREDGFDSQGECSDLTLTLARYHESTCSNIGILPLDRGSPAPIFRRRKERRDASYPSSQDVGASKSAL